MQLFGLRKPMNRGQGLGHYRANPTLDPRMGPIDTREAIAIWVIQPQIENLGTRNVRGSSATVTVTRGIAEAIITKALIDPAEEKITESGKGERILGTKERIACCETIIAKKIRAESGDEVDQTNVPEGSTIGIRSIEDVDLTQERGAQLKNEREMRNITGHAGEDIPVCLLHPRIALHHHIEKNAALQSPNAQIPFLPPPTRTPIP